METTPTPTHPLHLKYLVAKFLTCVKAAYILPLTSCHSNFPAPSLSDKFCRLKFVIAEIQRFKTKSDPVWQMFFNVGTCAPLASDQKRWTARGSASWQMFFVKGRDLLLFHTETIGATEKVTLTHKIMFDKAQIRPSRGGLEVERTTKFK